MSNTNQFSWKEVFKELGYFLSYVIIAIVSVEVIQFFIKDMIGGGSRPIYTSDYFLRSFFTLFVCIGLVFTFLRHNRKSPGKIALKPEYNLEQGWMWTSFRRTKRLWGFSWLIFFSFYFLSVFYYDAELFRDLSSDEKLVENLSAGFSFISSVICLIAAIWLFRSKIEGARMHGWLASAFSIIFFVICMEETGWGHGIFFFEPPEYLIRGNSQGEMNFHNHATYHFELAYYFSTFLFFVVLPFFNDFRLVFRKIPVLSFFIPSRMMVYMGAMAMAYNYDMWNQPIFQASFFIAALILGYYAWMDSTDKHERILKVVFVVYIFTQLSFLIFGHNVERTPSFKEYKEFFIPFTFLMYSMELLGKTKIALVQKKL